MSATATAQMTETDRRQAIEDNMPLVYHLARDLHSRASHLDYDDLVSAGSEGLVKAVDRFDPGRGRPMGGGYLRTYILGAMQDDLKKQDWAPRDLRKNVTYIHDTAAMLASSLGRQPTTQETARAAGMKPEKVESLQHSNFLTRRVDVFDLDSCHRLASAIPTPETQVLDQEGQRESRRRLYLLGQALSALPEHLAWAVTGRYYLGKTVLDLATERKMARATVNAHIRRGVELLSFGVALLDGQQPPCPQEDQGLKARQDREQFLDNLGYAELRAAA